MLLTPFLQESYWRVVFDTGRTLSERDQVADPGIGRRPADWTLDLVTTGDILRVRELHLIYPGLFTRPAVLRIGEPGTAFEFKTGGLIVEGDGTQSRQIFAQVIGRVDDKASGDCTCWIWDYKLGLLQYHSNIGLGDRWFGTWDPGRIAPTKTFNLEVLGLRL